jgi:mannose-1-phosphate guanylyltransferase
VAKTEKVQFYPVILAGGRGTRFWPLSRKRLAKQLLPLNSKQSMIQETVTRLTSLAKEKNFWIVSNQDLHAPIAKQLKKLNKKQILAEPVGRNTAPAIGLAAFILVHHDPDAVLGLFPSDHVIADEKGYKAALAKAIEIAAAGENIVTLGIKPQGPETGYGYIETGKSSEDGVVRVRRFREKPDAKTAEQFVASGNYFWNSGMFIWSASTLVHALREHLPNTAKLLEQIAATHGTRKFDATFAKLYPKCENISVDYAVLEPRSAKGEEKSNIYCIPADVGWNDLGSWSAHFDHRISQGKHKNNVIEADKVFTADANGNYVHAPGKFVALVGVEGLVVVDSGDALLITTRERAQDVGKVTKYLDEKKMKKLI